MLHIAIHKWYIDVNMEKCIALTRIRLKETFNSVDHQITLENNAVISYQHLHTIAIIRILTLKSKSVNGETSSIDIVNILVPQGQCLSQFSS